MSDRLAEILAALATARPADADDLAAARVVDMWRWSLTDTAGLFVRGLVDGREWTTGEVMDVDRGANWVRDTDGALWRLGRSADDMARTVGGVVEIIVRIQAPDGEPRELARARVVNAGGTPLMSHYAIEAGEGDNPVAGRMGWSARGHILRHERRLSVWALVARAASWASAEAEKR